MSVKRINCCVETKPCVKPFPKLMKSRLSGTIMIVNEDYCGVVLVQGRFKDGGFGSKIGEHITVPRKDFEDYNEPLTLQNE